jgi:hypothetical protein
MASDGYLAKSAQVAGVTLNGTTSFSVTEGVASQPNTRSDGNQYETRTILIPDNVTVSIESVDANAGTLGIGTSGALSLVSDKMTTGVTLDGTLTFSAASCTVTSVTRGTDRDGNASFSITARINSPDGSASGFTVASA